ncbi:HlyD family efflux transporter periplasmic adaptor subunit [Shewanella sp. Scap07]|uniref:efflux RND transporter periplasmic adaptor subunit n=1 Tax=Shewanella sp. Scap07 TaxID=2589987 RepID=UPI0015BFECB0|nr:HlyD family efflux transporter periplasmic adaptor subunit [Shewanella sp. Scap07]QLE85798.1 HlyD family efflux transporter periplasmic adaptor subunit [Shewanella sp. Scap07]
MDITRATKKGSTTQRTRWLIGGIATTALICGLLLTRSEASHVVSRDTLLTDQVQRGEMLVTVRGTGLLVPKDIRWIATHVEGRVEQILIKAGARVKTGDLLLVLSNPLLEQQLEETKWELEELEAETQALQVAMESELLDQQAAVVNEKLNYERALLTLNAHNQLLEQGIIAVSKIAHEEIKIDVDQFKKRWQLETQRLNKRKENLVAQRLAYQARINRMKRILHRVKTQVDALNVTASMDSIVQEMPMELGQQVNAGTNLAKLARDDKYLAELRIPEKKVKEVVVGQRVTIDTRNSLISGTVQRIDPAVINSSVQIDVALEGELPIEVRPDLTVEGVVEIDRISDTLYVQRPMFIKGYSQSDIYLINEEGDYAYKRSIKFGRMSSRYIQVQSGLKLGESIIVSDASSWNQHNQIKIN